MTVKNMKLTDIQKKNLEEFLEEKRRIVSEGEMKEHHLLRMEELGFGNGGVVLKVQHKPTGIIMARKVKGVCVCEESGVWRLNGWHILGGCGFEVIRCEFLSS